MILKIVIISLVCIVLFFTVFDSFRFVVKKYTVTSEKIKSDKTIVFLSDLHGRRFGRDNSKIINRINELKPDLVLLGGDMITAQPGEDFTQGASFVKTVLKDRDYVYAEGNHEYRAKLYPDTYGSLYDDYCETIAKDGIRMSVNESADFFDDIRVFSLSINYKYYRRFKHDPMEEDYVTKTIGEPSGDRFNILLAHNPDFFDEYVEWGGELILSGHVHGGVVRIPFWKGLLSPMCKFFPKYDGGKFTRDGKTMIVSRGLGIHTIPFRLFNPAEIDVIRLRKA